jgi:HlyD family secretion protein
VTKDPQTGAPYYMARVRVDEGDLAKFNELKLVAGMPVESFIQTGERTALSYLVKPFRDQLTRAFREE